MCDRLCAWRQNVSVGFCEDRMLVRASPEMVMNNFPILSIFALDMLIQMLDKSHGGAREITVNAKQKRQNDTQPLNCLKFA